MSHRPRKRFGQHFLHDPYVIGRIVDAIDPRPGETLVEIGPGQGALTDPVLARAGRLHVVEVDRDLAAALRARGEPGLTVHEADALRFDFSALAGGEAALRIFGNLPYNISTPLLFRLLTFRGSIRDLHFMLQKEVVTRMCAAPGGRDYGRLTVMLAASCRVEAVLGVGRGAFRPPPRVESAVVRLTPLRTAPFAMAGTAAFARLVTTAFSHRRKTLRNALGRALSAGDFAAAGVDPEARPQTLEPAQFGALAAVLAAAGHETPER